MKILILGGDSRYIEIINNLKDKHSITTVGYNNIKFEDVKNDVISNIDIGLYDIIIFPIGGVKDKNNISCEFNSSEITLPNNLLINSKENVLILSGIKTPNLDNMLTLANRKATYLMQDKDVIKKNAVLTTEGILADIIYNTSKALNDSKILVFGYGNIGSLLVKYLGYFKADVKVSVKEEKDIQELTNKGIPCFYSNNKAELIKGISTSDIIINTVPSKIIDDDLIKYINKECYFLDIASHPHGINKNILDNYYIDNKIYLGIPSKVAPKTAGKILLKKISQIMEDS